MAQWVKGQSGNKLGRPRVGTSAAELARGQIEKHTLIEKLGCLAAREGEYAKVDFAAQLNAIKILLAYGYGQPVQQLERSGVPTHVTYEVHFVDKQMVLSEGDYVTRKDPARLT